MTDKIVPHDTELPIEAFNAALEAIEGDAQASELWREATRRPMTKRLHRRKDLPKIQVDMKAVKEALRAEAEKRPLHKRPRSQEVERERPARPFCRFITIKGQRYLVVFYPLGSGDGGSSGPGGHRPHSYSFQEATPGNGGGIDAHANADRD